MKRYGLNNVALWFVSILMGLLGASCVEKDVAPGEFVTIDNGQWKYGKTLTFNTHVDTLANDIDAVALSLRHTDDYAYANLWVELSYTHSDSTVCDTFNIRMSDAYGKWYGSGSGPVVMLTDTLRLRQLPDPGSKFGLRHVMRTDVLEEIEQIGLTFHTIPRVQRPKIITQQAVDSITQ